MAVPRTGSRWCEEASCPDLIIRGGHVQHQHCDGYTRAGNSCGFRDCLDRLDKIVNIIIPLDFQEIDGRLIESIGDIKSEDILKLR